MELTISDYTGIQDDTCVFHTSTVKGQPTPSPIKERCQTIKFTDTTTNKTKQAFIDKHNSSKRCLNTCMLHWKERQSALYRLLSNVQKVCHKLKIPWTLYYGGLLGWQRQKELLPWDSDIDIVVPHTLRFKEGVLYEDSEVVLTIKKGHPVIGTFIDKSSLLYCDIFYWYSSSDKVFISWGEKKQFMTVDKKNFFPLRNEKIGPENLMIVVPQNPLECLKRTYKDFNFIPYKLYNNTWIKKL